MRRTLYDQDHEAFRATVRAFIDREVTPHVARWDADHLIDRSVWLAAGKQGLIGAAVPEQYGGAGERDYRFRAVLMEELGAIGAAALSANFGTQDDIVLPYLLHLGTEEQKQRWLPGMACGELIGAIAMSEPGAGSDLQGIGTTAVRDGDGWILNGSKTFITNGIHGDVIVTFARTDRTAGSRGFSLFVVEAGMPGFERGRKLEKVGMHGCDTAELFFRDVRIPADNLLGTEGKGFAHLMANLPTERLSIALQAYEGARAALRWTVTYTKDRTAFGTPVAAFQNSAFALAEMATELDVVGAYLDASILALNDGDLTPVDAAKAKLWATELFTRVCDRCLQLFGGFGYMLEYPIARAYLDARVTTIFGGTSEVMKTIIARDLTGLRS
ncbi:MAG: hypothetical protein JWL64_147 [Frankiales bacterium]|nr:hypothetical protein [Frankiales bacterium]